MEVKTHLDSVSPITQSIEAVKSLLAYVGRASDPLPTSFEMPGERCVLVLSNKKDVYYTVTQKACSCPSATYRPGQPCKHQRKYFPAPRKDLEDLEAESDAMLATMKGPKKLVQPPVDSIRPKGKWPGGFNGPVDLETIKAESHKSTILPEMLIDCGYDTTPKDIAYWQKKQGQEA